MRAASAGPVGMSGGCSRPENAGDGSSREGGCTSPWPCSMPAPNG